MGLGEKFKNFVSIYDEEEDNVLEFEEDEVGQISSYEKGGKGAVPGAAKMVLFEPRSFSEAEDVAKRLKEKRAAVVNLHKLTRENAQRTIDFLTGVVIALDGSIQMIGQNVILCTPKNVDVQGQISINNGETTEQ